jgi:hypothetical protein
LSGRFRNSGFPGSQQGSTEVVVHFSSVRLREEMV